MGASALSKEEMKKFADEGVKGKMGDCLLAMHKSKKPTIAVVRGGCVGIAFTTLCLADFVYVSPDAYFQTPFMASFQSPEGSSTINFPELMGRRMAYEVLMMDRALTAKESIACGFANGMVEGFDEKEWFDLQKVPAI